MKNRYLVCYLRKSKIDLILTKVSINFKCVNFDLTSVFGNQIIDI